ncbi:PBAN-type neuropeptides-like [Papilio machaon]|uniref:PBAN-type neuropeptides-like n=1 Tax=Papilio machaon TaxID=76193 RepID=UPI001E665ADE|nr:PBAN-type neuropeptides-like [Papilio machaon]
MFSIAKDFLLCFFVFNLYILLLISCEEIKEETLDRGAHSDRNGLWFGPRLGKRSLSLSSEDNSQKFLRLLEAADTLKYYYDQLPYYESQVDEPQKVIKKVIFTPKLGRSLERNEEKRGYENVEFTPRLGRRVPDSATTPEQEISGRDRVDIRSEYFSPRLGRTVHFSPRLGRELTYELYPENIRVARSVNDTRSN